MTDQALPGVPLFSEPVLGYRRWRLKEGWLFPLNDDVPWKPGNNEARCQLDEGWADGYRPDHDMANCACGFYAWHDAPSHSTATGDGGVLVCGAVIGWGRVMVYGAGFRAEHARIVGFYEGSDARARDRAHAAADRYEVPVVPSWSIEHEARRYGEPIDPSARPQVEHGMGIGNPAGVAMHFVYCTAEYEPIRSPNQILEVLCLRCSHEYQARRGAWWQGLAPCHACLRRDHPEING